MSPHGKRAGSQAQGQPRPPPSTLRAPDPRGCAPRAPGSIGAAFPGTARMPASTHLSTPQGAPVPPSPPRTWASQAQKDTGRGALRPLPPLPPPEQDASPRAATLHNRNRNRSDAPALQQPGV